MDVKEALIRNLNIKFAGGHEVRSAVQNLGNASGLREKGLHTVADTTLGEPDIGYFKSLIREQAAWESVTQTCFVPSETYMSPTSLHGASPDCKPAEVISRATITQVYLMQRAEYYSQFPRCERGVCGDGDACLMLDNVIAMAAKNFDVHFNRSLRRKMKRKKDALLQPTVWALPAMAAAGLDLFVYHHQLVLSPQLAQYGWMAPALIAAGWLMQQAFSRFDDRNARTATVLQQTEMENAINVAAKNAGMELKLRQERIMRLMENSIGEAQLASRLATMNGHMVESADEVGKWLRIFEFLKKRLDKLHDFIRASTPLIDISFNASEAENDVNDAVLQLPDKIYGIGRKFYRGLWYGITAALTATGGASLILAHRGADLITDPVGLAALGLFGAAAASCITSWVRLNKIDSHLSAPISAETVRGLSDNLVKRLPTGDQKAIAASQERRLNRLQNDWATLIQAYPPGTFPALQPLRQVPLHPFTDDLT